MPSTITVSKEFTADWMNRFATAKIAFCKPAGMPSISRSLVTWPSAFIFFMDRA